MTEYIWLIDEYVGGSEPVTDLSAFAARAERGWTSTPTTYTLPYGRRGGNGEPVRTATSRF